VVDGSNFLKWQRDPSVGSRTDLEANNGMVASSITTTSTTVPEPATGIILMLGIAVTMSLAFER
jgi:hypothetical protein